MEVAAGIAVELTCQYRSDRPVMQAADGFPERLETCINLQALSASRAEKAKII